MDAPQAGEASRQAITKWETKVDVPDIENLIAVSALFDVSLDELLSNELNGMKSELIISAYQEDNGTVSI